MRTATPLVTWSMITEYGPSATVLEISTPRFIGPGCRMMTSLRAFATASPDRQYMREYSSSDEK